VNKENLASEVFKEQTSQSTYNIHPDLSQDVHSVTKFDDEIRWCKIQWRKSVTNIQWDLRLLGTYDDIFGTLIIRQRCSAYWVHLWLQSFGALGCCSHILHCVLTSQKHLWRIVVARKFGVFRVFDVLCGACRKQLNKSWNSDLNYCAWPVWSVSFIAGYLSEYGQWEFTRFRL
jgi:uncharacterized CHY-type Zn-finger protein